MSTSKYRILEESVEISCGNCDKDTLFAVVPQQRNFTVNFLQKVEKYGKMIYLFVKSLLVNSRNY